jgi:hypothetical protein
MVRELLACGLVWSAAAGFTASVCPCHPKAAEEALRRLCRRYVGLDVQRPERSMWHACDGLSSVSWMNVVGKPLLAKKPLVLAEHDDLRAELLDAGMLVTAGPSPQLGDLNRMEFPHAYGRAASMLAGHARPPRDGCASTVRRWPRQRQGGQQGVDKRDEGQKRGT